MLGLIDRRCSYRVGRDNEAELVSSTGDWRSRTLIVSCHAMCSSMPALSARSTNSQNAATLAVKMACVPPWWGDPRTRRDINLNMDSPLSNFLPSGSMSFTLKISSNSTPAMLLTLRSPNFPLAKVGRVGGKRLVIFSATPVSKSEVRTKIKSRD